MQNQFFSFVFRILCYKQNILHIAWIQDPCNRVQSCYAVRAIFFRSFYVFCSKCNELRIYSTHELPQHESIGKQTWLWNIKNKMVWKHFSQDCFLYYEEELSCYSVEGPMFAFILCTADKAFIRHKVQTKNYYYFSVKKRRRSRATTTPTKNYRSHWITKMRSKCTSSQVQSNSLINCVCTAYKK